MSKTKESVQKYLIKRLVNNNFSFTTVGMGLAIVVAWVLFSKEILVRPSVVVWAGIIMTGAGIGAFLDWMQYMFDKYIE